jgi:hypothetical protein
MVHYLTHYCRDPVSGASVFFDGDPEQSGADLLWEISARHNVPIIEVYRMVRWLLCELLDPVPYEERTSTFKFSDYSGPPTDPYVDCHWLNAWHSARYDAERLTDLLRWRDLPLKSAMHILLSFIRWAEFWAVRSRTPEWREKYRKEAEEGRAQLAEIEVLMLRKLEIEPH